MSKGLLALYKNYLLGIRVKKMQKKIAYKKFFKKRWLAKFRQIRHLRGLIEWAIDKERRQARIFYQREFELKESAFLQWLSFLNAYKEQKLELIQTYKALNHYKNSIVARTFRTLRSQ